MGSRGVAPGKSAQHYGVRKSRGIQYSISTLPQLPVKAAKGCLWALEDFLGK